MNITKKTRLAIGVVGLSAAVGLAAGGAFTGTGVTNNAGSTQFIGGTITQTVTGAVMTAVVYGPFTDAPANTQTSTITLTFSAGTADGKAVALAATAAADTGTWTCDNIGAGSSPTHVSICTDSGVATSVNSINIAVS